MANTSRKKAYSSSRGVVGILRNDPNAPEPPPGITLTAAEQRIWDQFTKIKTNDRWRALDLNLLVRVVRIELELRAIELELGTDGYTVVSARGTEVIHPLFKVKRMLLEDQLKLLRTIGATIRPRLQAEKDAETALEEEKVSGKMKETDDELLPKG